MWLALFGSVLTLIGVIFIFDGRRVVRKHFNFGEENVAVLGLKIVGFLIIFIGAIILITNQ